MWRFQLGDVPLPLIAAWYIGVLVFLEGLLSADNALVLAVMVRHLPRKQQRRVLFYGIWGAVIFRIIALSLSSILLKLWYCKLIGGGYLLYLAISHFLWHRGEGETPLASDESPNPASRRLLGGFWGTVTSITMADIAFSIDSILAAVAMAESFPDRFGDRGKLFIVFAGGVLGIITMRFVVRYFLILLDRFPGLSEGAYYLVAWIGLKLMISGFHDGKYLGFHIPELMFWAGMILIAVVSLLVKPRAGAGQAASMSQSLDLLDSEEETPAQSSGAKDEA
jgi:YkoY family integral membrane protein